MALVLAVSAYADPALRALRAPGADAEQFGQLLADPDVGGFSVTSLVDEPAQRIRLAVEEFLADRNPGDLVLLYVSCHGLVDLRRRLYFAAQDTLKQRLAATGVEAGWLLEQLEDCRARRQVLILDCCFSGAFAQGAKGDPDLALGERLLGQGRGRVVLTASRATEYSFEGEPLPGAAQSGSVFTQALVTGIRSGAADSDGDGYISVDDAYSFAFTQVREAGAEQTPQRWLYGAEGDIVLARSPAAGDSPQSDEPTPPQRRPGNVSAPPPSPPVSGAGSERTRRRLAYATVTVAAAGVAAAVVLVWAPWRPTSPADEGSTAPSPGEVTTGPRHTITASAPWRISVKDNTDASQNGCRVTLTNTDNGRKQSWTQLYGLRTFQVHDSGTFRWSVNDPGCLVLPLPGANMQPLPFTLRTGAGDSGAFEADGQVQVTVTNFEGSPTCELTLHALSDGRPLAFREVKPANPTVALDTLGEPSVYLGNLICGVHVDEVP